MTFAGDLDLEDTDPGISRDTSSSCEDQLCQVISKSMHVYRSYGADTKAGLTDGQTNGRTDRLTDSAKTICLPVGGHKKIFRSVG